MIIAVWSSKFLHGEQYLQVLKSLRGEAILTLNFKLTDLLDKKPGILPDVKKCKKCKLIANVLLQTTDKRYMIEIYICTVHYLTMLKKGVEYPGPFGLCCTFMRAKSLWNWGLTSTRIKLIGTIKLLWLDVCIVYIVSRL
jgi:hypothetical protein